MLGRLPTGSRSAAFVPEVFPTDAPRKSTLRTSEADALATLARVRLSPRWGSRLLDYARDSAGITMQRRHLEQVYR